MKLYELLKGTGIANDLVKEDTEIVSITCDSRRVEPGCLFVCIAGTAVACGSGVFSGAERPSAPYTGMMGVGEGVGAK